MAKVKKQAVEFNASIHGEMLNHLIRQASDHKAIAESATEAIGELKRQAKDELGVDSKMFGNLFKMYHKDQREEFEDQNEEVIAVYDSVFTK